MTKQQYTDYRNNHQLDMMPVYHFFFNTAAKIKGYKSLSLEEFRYIFSHWFAGIGGRARSEVQYYTFTMLDKYFSVN